MTFREKVAHFLAVATVHINDGPGTYGKYSLHCDFDGLKYHRVYRHDSSGHRSVRYFIAVEDGTIYAASSWKKPNPKRSFGTLDTIDQFDWSGYEGVALPDSAYYMKTTAGPYATAVLKGT